MTTLLRGARVALRPVEKTDLPLYTTWYSQYELLRTLSPAAIRLMNLDGEDDWYRSVQANKSMWTFAADAVDDVHHPDGRLIGSVSLMAVDPKNHSAIFGISVADPALRGKGYGSEMIDLMLEWGFYELNLHRIQLSVMEFNPGAVRLYERKGFRHDGRLREAIWREGRYWDEHVMSILRREWVPPRPELAVGTEWETTR